MGLPARPTDSGQSDALKFHLGDAGLPLHTEAVKRFPNSVRLTGIARENAHSAEGRARQRKAICTGRSTFTRSGSDNCTGCRCQNGSLNCRQAGGASGDHILISR